MSVNYASGLSHYPDKGKCGLPEKIELDNQLDIKINKLVDLIKSSKHFIAFTGAGVSTSIGIPDFRGPKGVWTLEQKGVNILPSSVTFDNALPSITHLALNKLEESGYLKFLVTQNVDGIHLRSGFPRNRLAILHGDMFIEECSVCKTQYIRQTSVPTMGRKFTGNYCVKNKVMGNCRGKLTDTVLDWEDNLPEIDMNLALEHSKEADLILCLGTSLQIEPAGSMPIVNLKKRNKRKKKENNDDKDGIVNNKEEITSDLKVNFHESLIARENVPPSVNLVIVNLQPTKQDRYASLRIFQKVDYVMSKVCQQLSLDLIKSDITIPNIILKSQHTVPRERLPWKVIINNSDNKDVDSNSSSA